MSLQQLKKELLELGFFEVGQMPSEELSPLNSVRKMCEDNRCGLYGKRWCCPPYCGELSFFEEIIKTHSTTVVLTTVGKLSDEFDYEGMTEAGEKHKQFFYKAIAAAKAQFSQVYPLGAGACTICESCTCPTKPCRFPEKMVISMEASGLLVHDVCEKSSVNYYNGVNTVTYVSALLL